MALSCLRYSFLFYDFPPFFICINSCNSSDPEHFQYLVQVHWKYKVSGDSFCCMVILKVVFFGDNVPKDRADKTIQAAKECEAFLVLGSSVMTMSAYRLVRCIYIFHCKF